MSAKIPTELTIQDKASLTTGRDFWSTTELKDTDVPSLILTDGPHGLRLQQGGSDHLGLADSVPATCFPPAVTLGSTFDVSLLERVGAAIGAEARAQGVAVVLGPGINIKRSPLCGRNFEYISEDPLLSGALGAALVNGQQSQGVGSSLKHFAANNQEADRMRVSADIDPRPLREIYLRAFERVVRTASPWTVMCSYNRINGVSAAENRWLLTDVLRTEWGFDGVVVSDWGAVTNRVASLKAGLDLEMPGNPGNSVPAITEAIASGELDEAVLDESVDRLLAMTKKAQPATGPADLDANHALAREAAGKGIVLLKNENALLPVRPGTSLAVIGEFAQSPRYQGAGSSQVNPTKIENFLEEICTLQGGELVDFSPGYTLEANAPYNSELAAAAITAATHAETVIFLIGLPSSVESEGFDRADLKLPASQLELLEQVRAVNPNVVVALVGGGVVELPFADEVPAILAAWLGGQGGGGGLADVVTGKVNPSGRLAETIPHRLEDTPAALDFPGEHGHVRYGEGIFVGYRWYDARKSSVRYPFGHGLGYSSFEYSALAVSQLDDGLCATLKLRNTTEIAGREIVQLYLGLPGTAVARAPRSLAAFACIELGAGEEREVELRVDRSEIAYWDTRVETWIVEPGNYEVSVGASSRDIRLTESMSIAGEIVPVAINEETTLAELMADPIGGAVMAQFAGEALSGISGGDGDSESQEMMASMLGSMPIGRLLNFPGSPMTRESLDQLIGGILGARAAAAQHPGH
ncbi:glycosyl hydrolase [Arthrobacter sp. MYb227]|uniref:beta-glucosidase family protein n=1 Tax=Arthrobacter sp. MYb227 TaxID=1848601 RepID=UPI000CFDF318|nr:beta-glucosidase [Arthrobacter sp. MYb227]PQZ94838.1 glycosyl hydrolase [Arthrobacter sp. MYb227]